MGGDDLREIRVLVVEDEILIALEISDALHSAGATVAGPYASLEGAVEAAGGEAADIAVLDIDLHGEEVFPAARILRERGIPFLFYTGRPDREALKTTFAEIPVCIKPLSAPQLLEALGKLLSVAA